MAKYVFVDQGEVERLRMQARVWEPAAEALLDRVGVAPGARCVDLGCGPAGLLAPLARRVGPTGKVVGVELLNAQLAAARAHVEREGFTNVEVIEADAFDTRLPRGAFDLVHARFLLAPLGRADELLREMVALARPGGVVVLEEPDQNSWDYFPARPVWARVKRVFEEVFPRFGGDANAGQKLFARLRGLGLERAQLSAAVVALQDGHPYMRTPMVGLAAMRRFIVEGGLMTDGEIDDALREMDAIVSDPESWSTTFTLTQAWGYKPAR